MMYWGLLLFDQLLYVAKIFVPYLYYPNKQIIQA